MDYFDELDEKAEEKENKEKFVKNYKKTLKITTIILFSTFMFLGLVFTILGFALKEVVIELFYSFVPLGLSFVLFALLSLLILRTNPEKTYDNFQKRIKDGKIPFNSGDLMYRILYLEQRVKKLEEEIANLKK